MKAALLALGTIALLAQQPAGGLVQPPGTLAAGPLVDARDHQALLLGETTGKAILAHRPVFREHLAKVKLSAEVKARWLAVHHPFTLVVVFGSWCGDSHFQLPELLALDAHPNPFIEVRYIGVNRDKVAQASAWPEGCAPQQVVRVPTFYLFATQPGGPQKLVGSLVENPPRAGQTMGAALVELIEGAGKVL